MNTENEKNLPEQTPCAPQPPEKKKARTSRKFRYGTIATVTTVVVVVAVLLLNILLDTVENRYPLTVDLTADKTYTLSQDSIDLVSKLEKSVEIVVFSDEGTFSKPSTGNETYNTLLTQFYNTLQQYRLNSGDKVTYSFVDLDNNPTLASKYQAYGVTSGSILFLCGDRAQTITVNDLYSQDGSYYEGYTYTSEVERIVATKINQVSADSIKTITLLTGHGENSDNVSDITTTLENNGCTVEQVDITASAEPAENSSVFVLLAPTTDYTTDEIARLRTWLDNSGKREKDLLVFLNYSAKLPNLYELLNDQYGIEVVDNIVCETSAANVYNQNPYYTYGDIASTDYTDGLTADRALSPYTRQIKLTLTDSTDESNYSKPLVTFGETAKVQSLASANQEEGAATGEDSLAAADSYPIVGAAYTVSRLYDNNDNKYYATNVMVYGSESFMYSGLVGSVSSAKNEDVFLNTFRGLTGIENLISISGKSLSADTLDFGGSLVPMVLGICVFTIGLPVLLIVVAVVVFLRRRHL